MLFFNLNSNKNERINFNFELELKMSNLIEIRVYSKLVSASDYV
jgi:hypothetical protein